MRTPRLAACFALNSATVSFLLRIKATSSDIAFETAGSRRAQIAFMPSTWRVSSPATSANRAPPSATSLIAWSKGIEIHFPSPRFPARFRTFTIRYGS